MQLSSKARKAVALGLTASTIVWAASLAFLPFAASAAVHSDGCLVLSGGTVWLITGGVRRGFTSAEVFQSGGYNFGQVVAATAEDVALSVGPIMTYADGTLVKGPSDPLVYLVAGGSKLGFTSGAVFTGLGFSFANIQSAPANTFADLPLGANINSTAQAHGAGVLVSSGGTVWKMTATGRMGIPSMAVFNSYGYVWSHIVAANSYDLAMPDQGVVVARAVCSGGVTPPAPASGAFSVSLASDTPATASIIADSTNGGQALIPLVKLNFSGGASASTVTTITLHRIGVGNDSNINNAYLYDGSTRLAQMQSVSAGVVTFTAGAGLFTVSANTIRAITVKMDLNKSATAGQTYGLSLSSASDVVASGNVNPSGSFPISGNLMTVATVTDLGKLTVANVSPSAANSVDPQNNYEMWRFSLQASNQNLKVTYLAFTNIGSTNPGDIQNIKLFDGGAQLGATVAQQDSSRMVAFDLSASPLLITSGITKQLTLRGDLVGGSTRTFQWSFQNSSDILVSDQQYGVALFPGGGATFSVVKAGGATTINSGSLSISKTSDSPSGNVALNGTNVTLAKYEFKANGEAMKVTTLTITANVTSSHTLKNVKLYANGVQVGTTQTTVTGDNSTTYAFTLGNSLVVQPGTSSFVTVVADLTGTAVNTDTIVITLKQGSSNAQGQLSLATSNAPAADTNSNTLTISSSTLTGVKNPALANVATVKGAKAVTIGSYLLTAGAAEGVDVNSVVLIDSNGSGSNASNGLGSAFNNIKLMKGTTQLGSTVVNPSTTAGTTQTFSVSPALSITAGQSVQVDVVADILSGGTWTSTDTTALTTSTSGVGKTTTTTVSLSARTEGQTVTLNAAGTLTVSLDGSTPSAQQIVMGSTANVLAAWRFDANNNEDLTINQVIVDSTTTVGGDVQNLQLFVDGAAVGTVPALSAASNGSATFGTTTGTLFKVPSGSFKVLTLKADVPGQVNATGNAAITPKLTPPTTITGASTNKVIAIGSQSGAYALIATASQSTTYTANSSYAFRTKIVATNVTVPGNSTGRVRQSNDTVLKMNLAANAGYQVAFRAAALNNASATSDGFTGGVVNSGTWAAVNGGTDNGTIGQDSTNKVVASNSLQYAAGSTTGGASGVKYTIASSGTMDVSGYNGFAVWLRSSRGSAANVTITLPAATAGSHTYSPADAGWHIVTVPFTGATTAFTGLTAITGFQAVVTSAASSTLNIGGLYFYKDFIKANVNASANGPSNTAAAPVLVTAKDNDSGTTFAAGNVDMTTANTTGRVYFFPTSEFDVAAGANRNISLVTDTSSLLSASANLSLNVSLGSSSSSVTSPGDVVWYDGKVTQTATGPVSVFWVDTNPNPVQGASLGY